MPTKHLLASATSALIGAACSSSSMPAASSSLPPDGGGVVEAGATVTFHKDVEAILQQHCDMCHVANGIAPMPLVTYADTVSYASPILQRTTSRIMPPWGAVATSQCTPPLSWKDDPTLSDEQIATITTWVTAGLPEGDPKDAPPALVPHPIALSGVNADLSPPAPWALTNPMSDEFRCFVLDPQIAATTFLNGSFVVPGNTQIVHHALIFADPSGASRAKVTDQATQSYDCFGGPGIVPTTLLAGWAPGGLPTDYPANVGAALDAGTLLVMQVHYHPHTSAASLDPDQTHFQMRLTSTPPEYAAITVLPGNFQNAVGPLGNGLLPGPDDPASGPAFVIPPNVSGHTETMQFTIPRTMRGASLPAQLPLFAVGGHEHYVGTAVQVDLHRADPAPGMAADECLLSIPRWNFDWQRTYRYDAPIEQLPTVAPGDVMKITCTYDNTLTNPGVVLSLQQQGMTQPQTVRLGETTLDEMCLAPMVLLAKAQ